MEPKVVDFNTHTARLIPLYADPITTDGSLPPLEIVLDENNSSHSYVFLDRSELLQFQEALTGFEVVDGYIEYVLVTYVKLSKAFCLTL